MLRHLELEGGEWMILNIYLFNVSFFAMYIHRGRAKAKFVQGRRALCHCVVRLGRVLFARGVAWVNDGRSSEACCSARDFKFVTVLVLVFASPRNSSAGAKKWGTVLYAR